MWYILRQGSSQAEKYDSRARGPGLELDAETWYLADTGAKAKRDPLNSAAFTIVAASPKAAGSKLVRGWDKDQHSPPTLYMPGWPEAELQQCRQLITPRLHGSLTSTSRATPTRKGSVLYSCRPILYSCSSVFDRWCSNSLPLQLSPRPLQFKL